MDGYNLIHLMSIRGGLRVYMWLSNEVRKGSMYFY